MEFQHSEAFGRVSLDGRRDVSSDQIQQHQIPHNLEGDSRNGEYFDPAKYRDWGYQIVPLNRSGARSESPPRMDGAMDADTGADGIIPVQEERPRVFDQRDAGTQTVLSGEKQTFWVNRRVDLALIPCMWFVFGVTFDRFYEDSSHTIIRGCVTSATALAFQIVNYRVLSGVRIGRYLGVAVLIKGIAGLASSVVLVTDPDESDFGADIVIQILLAASNAVIIPCFVLLTAAWNTNTNGGCVVRLLLWATSYPVLSKTIHYITSIADSSSRVYHATYCGFATVCILLSVYIFACVDMPGVTMWLDRAHEKGRLRSRERWRQHNYFLPLAKLVAEPAAWFVFGATFFGAAITPLDGEVLPYFYRLQISEGAQAAFLTLLPVAAFAFLVVKKSITRVTILVLTASLAFAGRMLIVNNSAWYTYFYFELNTGVLFLRNMVLYWQYLLWAILLLISSEIGTAYSRNLVANIVVAFAGNALGRVLGYGALPALASVGDGWFDTVMVTPTMIFMAVMFGLQISSLIAWFVWLVWQRRRAERQKGGQGQLAPADPNAAAELEC